MHEHLLILNPCVSESMLVYFCIFLWEVSQLKWHEMILDVMKTKELPMKFEMKLLGRQKMETVIKTFAKL